MISVSQNRQKTTKGREKKRERNEWKGPIYGIKTRRGGKDGLIDGSNVNGNIVGNNLYMGATRIIRPRSPSPFHASEY